MPSKISLILINYNGTKYIKKCIDSLLNQTHKNFHIYFIDNVSTDNSISLTKNLYKQNQKITIIENKENTGYVGGANQGCDISFENKSKYLMILNPDIVFDENYIEKAITCLDRNPMTAAFTGKIRRYDFDKDIKTNYIDTVGLYCFPNRRIVDYGQGQEDKGQFEKEKEIFGVSGACPIYRLKALEDIAVPVKKSREIFDNDFFMYKEDVDISWRLHLRDWSIHYDPAAIAYHGRGTGILKEFSHKSIYKNRRNASSLAKYHAYKNQRLMQIKNEIWGNLIRDIFPILWKEILITGYILFREPKLLKATFHLLRQIPSAFKKRKYIQEHCKVNAKHMERWLHSAT